MSKSITHSQQMSVTEIEDCYTVYWLTACEMQCLCLVITHV